MTKVHIWKLALIAFFIFFGCSNSKILRTPNILKTGWYYISDTSNAYKRQLDKTDEFYYIIPEPIVTVNNFKQLEIREREYEGKKYFWLKMSLDEEGTKAWSIATGKSIGKHLAFILDNKLISTPKVNAQIDGGMTALNRGNETRAELEKIKTIIEGEKK